MTAHRAVFQINWNAPEGEVNTRCGDCGGDGVRRTPRGYLKPNGRTASVLAPSSCKTCKESGNLPGLQPPV